MGAESVFLSDEELDQTYAEGFSVHLSLDITSQTGLLSDSAFENPADFQLTSEGGAPNLGGESQTFLPHVNQSLYVGGNAFQNSGSLVNVASLGDVAVAVNLFVFIGDLVNSSIQHESANFNFSNILAELQQK